MVQPVPDSDPGSIRFQLLRFLPQPVIVTGKDSSKTSFNHILGFSPAAQILFPSLKPDQPLSFVLRDPELLDAVEATDRDGVSRKLEILERLPVQRFFAVDVVNVPDLGVLIAFEDQSASRNLERMRVDFVANASHELRTPLASLLGYVETLRGPARNDPDARVKFLGIMETQARRMARLIDDLLSLSRIELHAHLRPRDRIDLTGVVLQIRDALLPLSQERGVVVHVSSVLSDAIVTGERDELLRLFENLIENAIKYGAEGKSVDITIQSASSNWIAVDVRDSGPGIPAEHLPRLTERFYRVNAAASREAGGTGLGLAIVKHIVARHRGRLEITSEPGKGSCFRVLLELTP